MIGDHEKDMEFGRRLGCRGIQVSEDGIDPRRSFMIGDHEKDMEFGRRLGCRGIQVSEGFTFEDAVDELLRTMDD